MPAQFTIPLVTVIPGQLISSALWNNEFNNLNTNFVPAGMDGYSGTDAQMQIQTNPYPGSVTSHASNLGGELERLRYLLSLITGKSYWYQPPDASIATMNNSIVPVGGVIDFPSNTAPSANWHLADGTAIDRVIYAGLYTLIGTTFGIGDGATTFNLPNYTDRMSIAAGNLYALAATGGEATHTLVTAEIPSVTVTDPQHTHSVSSATTSIPRASGATVVPNGFFGAVDGTSQGASDNYTTTVNLNSSSTGITAAGGGGAHNNLPPYLGMFKMIRVI